MAISKRSPERSTGRSAKRSEKLAFWSLRMWKIFGSFDLKDGRLKDIRERFCCRRQASFFPSLQQGICSLTSRERPPNRTFFPENCQPEAEFSQRKTFIFNMKSGRLKRPKKTRKFPFSRLSARDPCVQNLEESKKNVAFQA